MLLYIFGMYCKFVVCCAATGALVGAVDYFSAKSRHRKSLRVLACRTCSFGAAAAVAPIVAVDAVASAVCLLLFPKSRHASAVSVAIDRINGSIGDFIDHHVNRAIKPMYGSPDSTPPSTPQLGGVSPFPFLTSFRATTRKDEKAKNGESDSESRLSKANEVDPPSPLLAQ